MDSDEDDQRMEENIEMAEFVDISRGGKALKDSSGYLYLKASTVLAKDRAYWYCKEKAKMTCAASAVTKLSADIIISKGIHNHPNHLMEIKVRQIEKNKIAAAATLPNAAPRTVFGDITATVMNTAPGSTSFIKSKGALAKKLQRDRVAAKGYPKKPKSFDDLKDIPPQLTKTHCKESFLILNDTVQPDSTEPGAKRLLVYMSETGKEVLAKSEVWYTDGTFKAISGTIFSQVFMVLGQSAVGKVVPCVFALLPDKEKATYKRVAEAIKQQFGDIPIRLKKIMQDYEKGMNLGFQSVFPEAEIEGCDFHFKQVLRRRISSDGLLVLYNMDTRFQSLVHSIWALTFVHPDDVLTAWDSVVREIITDNLADWITDWGDSIKSFLKYLDNQWIGELNARTQESVYILTFY